MEKTKNELVEIAINQNLLLWELTKSMVEIEKIIESNLNHHKEEKKSS